MPYDIDSVSDEEFYECLCGIDMPVRAHSNGHRPRHLLWVFLCADVASWIDECEDAEHSDTAWISVGLSARGHPWTRAEHDVRVSLASLEFIQLFAAELDEFVQGFGVRERFVLKSPPGAFQLLVYAGHHVSFLLVVRSATTHIKARYPIFARPWPEDVQE